MDPITQGLLGAAVSQTFCSKTLRRDAWWIGFLGGIAADLDLIIQSPNNPLLFLTYHRNFTHALVFIPVGGLIIGLLCLGFFKRLRPAWCSVIIAAILGYGTHGLLDACTSYGTLLFWPFSTNRVAWDIISIVDPVFSGILLVGVILSAKQIKALPAMIALLLVGLYLGFGAWQHHRAVGAQRQLIQHRGQQVNKSRVMPTLANVVTWNSIYIANSSIYLDTIKTPLFASAYAIQGSSVPLTNAAELPENVRDNPRLMQDYKIFRWFSDGFMTTVAKHPLIIGDMRYVRRTKPLTILWGFKFPSNQLRIHAIWVRNLKSYPR